MEKAFDLPGPWLDVRSALDVTATFALRHCVWQESENLFSEIHTVMKKILLSSLMQRLSLKGNCSLTSSFRPPLSPCRDYHRGTEDMFSF